MLRLENVNTHSSTTAMSTSSWPAAAAVAAIEGAGARVVPLPPSSPDMTPIEEMFSEVKVALRVAAARTTEAV
jgi:transposase